jgi:hypothetical protein
MPPVIRFHSPAQRSKDEAISFWHIPISIERRFKIGPGILPGCRVYLDRFEGGIVSNRILLQWGDACFGGQVGERATLTVHEILLVPICRRSENDESGEAYIADSRLLSNTESAYPLQPDRRKNRFKLRIKSGKKEFVSPYTYLIRVPKKKGNGHFVVEIEYEGEGSQ